MTAPTADPVCLCGDPKSEHRLGKRGCKVPGCGCDRFEAAGDAAEKTRVLNVVAEVCEDQADRARTELGEQSTSAQLREAREANDQLAMEHGKCAAEVERLRAEAEKNLNLWRICCRDREAAVAEHDLELAQLREQRDGLAARVDELQLLLEHVDQYARNLQTNGDVPPVEIHGWNAWQCFTCGARYRRDFTHDCGPLKPVRVSITER